MSRVPVQLQGDEDDTRDAHDDQMPSEISTVPSPIADDLQDSFKDTDKSVQELPDYGDLDEDKAASLPNYETAARLHTVKLSTMPSPIADDLRDVSKDVDADKPLQELPDLDENKAASLPTYETATRLHTVKLSTMPSPIADDLQDISRDTDDDTPLQELPDYNEIDENKALSLPTYESASKLHTAKMKGILQIKTISYLHTYALTCAPQAS